MTVRSRLEALAARHGLEPPAVDALERLLEILREDPTAPTTLRAVLKLERAGLARRIQDKNDARKTLVFLSPKGRKLFSRVVPDIDYVNRMALRGLSRHERNEVKRLLKHMRGNMPKKQRPDVRVES